MIHKTAPIVMPESKLAAAHQQGCKTCVVRLSPAVGKSTSGLPIQHLERSILSAEEKLK